MSDNARVYFMVVCVYNIQNQIHLAHGVVEVDDHVQTEDQVRLTPGYVGGVRGEHPRGGGLRRTLRTSVSRPQRPHHLCARDNDIYASMYKGEGYLEVVTVMNTTT